MYLMWEIEKEWLRILQTLIGWLLEIIKQLWLGLIEHSIRRGSKSIFNWRKVTSSKVVYVFSSTIHTKFFIMSCDSMWLCRDKYKKTYIQSSGMTENCVKSFSEVMVYIITLLSNNVELYANLNDLDMICP